MFERLRILLSRLVSVLLVVAIGVSGSHWQKDYGIAVAAVFMLGTMLVGIAALGRMWCSLYIAGYKNDRLVMDGPYSATRNPLYFFSFLGVVGFGLCTGTVTIPAAMIGLFAIYYPFVIATEEKRLEGRHGQAYLDYRKAVPAFFPRLRDLVRVDAGRAGPAARIAGGQRAARVHYPLLISANDQARRPACRTSGLSQA